MEEFGDGASSIGSDEFLSNIEDLNKINKDFAGDTFS